VQSKRLWSEALQRFLRVRVTARVLRTVDKCGGLDEYLLGEKSARVRELGMGGWKLRWRIMQTESVKGRFRAQREALGLVPKGAEEGLVGADGGRRTREQVEEEVRRYDEELTREADVDIEVETEGVKEDLGIVGEEPTRQERVLL